MARIYVASSWRNEWQPIFVQQLRYAKHEVYDFRDPPNVMAFKWSNVGVEDPILSVEEYRSTMLINPKVAQNYLSDYRAMNWADVGLLLLPAGRSAHLELGYMAGRGKRTIILLYTEQPPDLMQLMADHLCISIHEVLEILK